jgi:hypothetical protein
MTFLARKISKPNFWADFEDQGHWKGGNFPFPVLNELRDGFGGTSGLSCFAVKSKRDPSLRRLAVALQLGTNEKTIPNSEFRLVSFKQLNALGINHNQTDGVLRHLADLNKLHYAISNLSGNQAVALARAFNRSVTVINLKEMAREVAQCVVRGDLKLQDIPNPILLELRKYGGLKAVLIKKEKKVSPHKSG